jgi:cytochrome c oxidase subunit 1
LNLQSLYLSGHKQIGRRYFFLALIAALTGVLMSLLMRLRLAWPERRWPLLEMLFPLGFKDGLMQPEFYLAMVTMHGTIMIFLVLTVAPQSAFGNFFLPIQIGAREMAFPRLNALSFWLTALSFLILLAALFVEGGAPIGGWTFYPPLSSVRSTGPGQGMGADLWLISVGLFCIASMMGAVCFVVTTLLHRAEGMSLGRMPLTVWSWLITAIMILLSFPVLLVAAAMLFLDRNFGAQFFTPAGLVVTGKLIPGGGGSPLMWQHLFWFFGHPEVYIAILPGMGVVSHIMANFTRRPVYGHAVMVGSMAAIGGLGFLVWGHHMFISGMNPRIAIAFSTLTLVIGVPSAVKTLNWLGALWGASIRFTTPMLFAIGFVSLFVSGGITGLVLGQTSLDMVMHDTYFVVGHFHLIMGVAAVFGIFAATYYWFPKLFGRMMNERLGQVHFWATFFGVYLIFIPFHLLGFAGHPRRYPDGLWYEFLKPLGGLQSFITHAALMTAVAQLVFLYNLFRSIRRGEIASDNPWQGTTLEWSTATPIPPENFSAERPVVYQAPYAYASPGATKEYLMQMEKSEEGLEKSR